MSKRDKHPSKSNLPKNWIKIKDFESAQEAIRQTYVIGFTLAAMHGALLIILLVGYQVVQDQAQNIPWMIFVVVFMSAAIPLSIALRIRNNKLGLAPVLILWGCAEGVYLFFKYIQHTVDTDNSNPIITMFVVIPILGIFALRGFNAFEAYNQIREGLVKQNDNLNEGN